MPSKRLNHIYSFGMIIILVTIIIILSSFANAQAKTTAADFDPDCGCFQTYLPFIAKAKPTPTYAEQVIELTNQYRTANGCSPLTENVQLTQAAQIHSDDMAKNNFLSHTGSDGSLPEDRINRTGYSWSLIAENAGVSYKTPEEVVAAWMSSSGHRGNILDCRLEDIGVGYSYNAATSRKNYWVQVFGTSK